MTNFFFSFILAVLVVFSVSAQTIEPEIPLQNTAQEARSRELFRELRCEVCAGQTIADSNATLAKDMRMLVRDKVTQGEDNAAILTYFSDRYGDDILMRPPLNSTTAPLWWGPLFVVLLGGWFMVRYFARKKQSHF